MCLPSWKIVKYKTSGKRELGYAVAEVNEACLSLFGVKNLFAFEQFFRSNILPQLTNRQADTFSELEDKSSYYTQTFNFLNVKDEAIDCMLVFKGADDTNTTVDISVIDISEFEQSKRELNVLNEQLAQSLMRYELVVEGSDGAIWDWNVLDDSVYYSENWCLLRGGTKSDFSEHQREWVNTIHPDDKSRVLAAVQAHIAGKTAVFTQEYRILCLDGSCKWVSDRGIAKRNEHGNVIRMAGSVFNITAQRAAKEQLRLAASVYENISEAAVILNSQGKMVNINQAFTKILGYPKAEILYKAFSDIFDGNDHGIITNLIKRRYQMWSDDINVLHAKKRSISCKLTLNRVDDAEGELTHFVCLISDMSETKRTEQLLHNLAYHDALTALPNRFSLRQRLAELIQQTKHTHQHLALFFIDLDNFKFVNDGLGHAAGDQLLCDVANTLKTSVRKEDFVARLGGDEFVVVMDNITNTSNITKAAEQLLSKLRYKLFIDAREVLVSASIGISVYPNDGLDVDTLMQNADTAMYQAKERGKQNFQYYKEHLTQKAIERVSLEADIDRAIEKNEFVLFYQPQLCIDSQMVKGVEALIRWQPEGKEMIFPDRFIGLAEENGAIVAIGHWVLHEACRQAKKWLDEGAEFGIVSVNVSAKQLQSKGFIASVKDALLESQLPAKYLELEITESSILQQPLVVIERLKQINQMGVSLAIDDFGTGYSSLSYLKKLPIHRLKIDRLFVSELPNDEDDAAITETIIAMAAKLGLDVVAEGVESEAQAHFLLENGCQIAQGYYFSRPLSLTQINDYFLLK